MFQSNKLIQRFHHIYLIQALVEIQRHCNNLFLKFKHQVLYVVRKRLHLSRLKLLNGSGKQKSLPYDGYIYDKFEFNGQSGIQDGRIAGSIMENLNQWLINPHQGNNVSIPMQMLLLPFIIQPHGIVVSGNNVTKPDSCHMYRGGQVINNNKSSSNNNDSSRIECQQWHGVSNVNVCGPSNYVTLVPSQILSAQSQTTAINEHPTFMSSEQKKQLEFCPTSRATQDCRHNNNGSYCNFRSTTSWSKVAKATSCDSYDAKTDNYALPMRNPLMNYPATSRRQL